jgi:hypothetical protein
MEGGKHKHKGTRPNKPKGSRLIIERTGVHIWWIVLAGGGWLGSWPSRPLLLATTDQYVSHIEKDLGGMTAAEDVTPGENGF